MADIRAPAAEFPEDRREAGIRREREGKVVEVEKEKERVLGVVRKEVEDNEDLGWSAIGFCWRDAIEELVSGFSESLSN